MRATTYLLAGQRKSLTFYIQKVAQHVRIIKKHKRRFFENVSSLSLLGSQVEQ